MWRKLNMKRFIIVLSVCAVASLAWATSGFSWTTYDGGCGTCHGTVFADLSHDIIPLWIAANAMW